MILNTAKINFWVVGITMIFAGSVLLYLEDYRNSEYIFAIVYLLIFLGWMVLFMQVIKGTIVDAKKVPFSEDKVKFLQQGIAKFFAYIIVVAIIGCNMFYIWRMAKNRTNEILQNSPTKIAVAQINRIETSQGRSGTHYHAIFVYKTEDGKSISYSWSEENKGDFIEGQKYEIKYAVEYPEMFRIIRQVQ
jgi:hypothetical protein